MAKITKGAKGKIGQKVKTEGGSFVHERQVAPKEGCRYITKKTKSGKELRIMYCGKKGKLQSDLTPIKKKK
jgi:hypothetical protein